MSKSIRQETFWVPAEFESIKESVMQSHTITKMASRVPNINFTNILILGMNNHIILSKYQ